MQDYQCRQQLEDYPIVFHSFPRHRANLNQCARASATRRKENTKQLREHDALIKSQLLLTSNSTVPKRLEELKGCLYNCSDEVKNIVLKEILKYGEEGFKLVAKIVKNERGLIQLIACDLLWKTTNYKGRWKLLNYLSRHPEVCANYIEKVLEPSLVALQEEQEQQRQALAKICNTQEFLRQQYKQAILGASKGEQSHSHPSIPDLPSNVLKVRQDEQTLPESEPNAHCTKNPVSEVVRDYWEHPTQSDSITANSLNQEAIALKVQLDQQTLLVNNLLPDLVLISKLFEAKAKKHLVEAQTFAKALEQIKKAFLKIEVQWQEIETVIDYEQLPGKLLQLLETLISEMQNHQMVLRQTVARAITTQLQIHHHYNLAKKAATYCEYRSQLDWQEGNEKWARESLVRRKTYVDTATILKLSLEQQRPQLESFKCHLFVLQTWLSLAGQMKNTLKVGSSFTWVQEAQALLWHRIEFPYNTSSVMAELEPIQ